MSVSTFLVSLIFGVCSVGAIHLSRVVYGDGFAPVGVFFGATLTTLSLWHLKLASLVSLSGLVYFIIFLSLIGFLVGAFLAAPQKWLYVEAPSDSDREIVRGNYLRFFFWTISLLSTFGWILLLAMFVQEHSLSAIWQKPFLLQTSFQSRRFVGYFNLVGILVFPTYLVLRRARIGRRLLYLIPVLSAFTGLLLAGVKSYMIFSIVTAFLVWGNCRKSGAPLRHMALVGAIFLAGMIVYDSTIDIFVQRDRAENLLDDTLPSLYRPYIYMVGSWSALTVLAEHSIPQPVPGRQSLALLWKVLGSGFGLIEEVPDGDVYLEIANAGSQAFNVYSMAGGLYWDFGLIGVLLGCMFWGFVSSRMYQKARESRDWAWVLSSALINYGLFLSFFTYYFTANLLFLLFVVLIARSLRRLVAD